jgi:hypothetical protein
VVVRPWPGLSRLRAVLPLAIALAASGLILGHFYDRYWLPRDDGYYAHIADRLLHGAVLNRDVQELHSGYIAFANALALRLFGMAMVSLRFPLVALGVIQAGILFIIMRPRGGAVALVAAVALSSLSFVQFPDPSAHWYAQFLFIALIGWLQLAPPGTRWRIEIVGLLLATEAMMRQLTGVFVAIGAVAWLVTELPRAADDRRRGWLGSAIAVVMAAGIAGYLLARADAPGWAIFGIWPIFLLVAVAVRCRADNGAVLIIVLRLAGGFAVGLLPLVAYHVATGSLADWYRDTVTDAIALSGFDYIRHKTFLTYLLPPLRQLFAAAGAAELANGLYWPALLLSPLALGAIVPARFLVRGTSDPARAPLPFLAVFYGLVALHYQVPAYLYFMVGTTVAALLWLAAGGGGVVRGAAVAAALALSAIGLYYQAGQPFARGPLGEIRGERRLQTADTGLERFGLRIEADDARLYRGLVVRIRAETRPGDPILAIPAEPELFFLSGRRNPLPYAYVNFGIHDEATLARDLDTLRREPPRLVFHAPALPYNTRYTDRIMDWVRRHYDCIAANGPLVIYRYRGGAGPP